MRRFWKSIVTDEEKIRRRGCPLDLAVGNPERNMEAPLVRGAFDVGNYDDDDDNCRSNSTETNSYNIKNNDDINNYRNLCD